MAQLTEVEVDCIVSDYDMPRQNGLEFLNTIRGDYPELPFILFTGKGSEEVASKAISAGVTDYLQKGPGTEQYSLLANRIKNAVAQYRAEREVEQMEQRYRRLIEESTDVIIVIDENAIFQYLSPAAERRLGYTADELVGENAFEYVHPDDRESAMEQFVDQVRHPERRITAKFRFDHAYKEWTWLKVRGRNLLDDSIIDGVVVYARDVTDRKEREHELRRKNEQLEGFASVVSHDLRSPLNVAKGHLDLAQEAYDSPHLDTVGRTLNRMESLIEEILTLAREGERVHELESVNLADTVERCWHSIPSADATLVTETERVIQADKSRLQQLLGNLIRNAIDHGGDDVTIQIGDLDNGFYIADNGPVIPENRHEAVFESGHSATDAGAGLGLSIVKAIAEVHSWKISVTDSDVGGARFEITGVQVVQ